MTVTSLRIEEVFSISCLMPLFFTCIAGKSTAPIPCQRKVQTKKTHPFCCYHCKERFLHKSNLKKHELIHKNEKAVKVMKHPFLVVDSDSDGDIGEEILGQTETRSLKRPQAFMLRNLPTSLRARLDPMNGKFS